MTRGDQRKVDVFIIGGEQAGIPLAHSLAGEGRSVALAGRKHLGGTCVNYGCTPTKAVLASAQLAHPARRASDYGLNIGEVEVDFPAVRSVRSLLHMLEKYSSSQAAKPRPHGRRPGGPAIRRYGARRK